MNVELLTIPLEAGGARRMERSGRYLEIIEADAPVNVVFEAGQSGQAGRLSQALSGTYVEEEFSAFTIGSDVPQTVKLMVTDGRGGSRRQPGIVRVIDDTASKTNAGNQFIASCDANSASYSIVAMLAGSKTCIVKRIGVTTNSASTVLSATMYAITGAPTNAAVDNGFAQNKRIGASQSGVKLWSAQAVAATPTLAELPGRVPILTTKMPTGALVEVPLTTPIVLEPGRGLAFVAEAGGKALAFIADFEEV